jgi:hypothetical protein
MRDYKSYIEKLRSDAAEAELIRDLATVNAKREMFGQLARHLNQLANEVEHAMNAVRPANAASFELLSFQNLVLEGHACRGIFLGRAGTVIAKQSSEICAQSISCAFLTEDDRSPPG